MRLSPGADRSRATIKYGVITCALGSCGLLRDISRTTGSTRQLFPLARSDPCMLCCRQTRGAALGMGTEGFAVAWCGQVPAQPPCLELGGRGGCEVLALPAPRHGGGLQSRTNPSPCSLFSSHGPGSSRRTWARAQRPSGRASPADWELHGSTREVAFVRCLQGFCKMKGHGPACPGVWIKPHISPLGV